MVATKYAELSCLHITLHNLTGTQGSCRFETLNTTLLGIEASLVIGSATHTDAQLCVRKNSKYGRVACVDGTEYLSPEASLRHFLCDLLFLHNLARFLQRVFLSLPSCTMC